MLVQKSSSVDLVGGMDVVAGIALTRFFRKIAELAGTHANESFAVRRPGKTADATLEPCDFLRLAAFERKDVHLRLRCAWNCLAGFVRGRTRREKGDRSPVGRPFWRSR